MVIWDDNYRRFSATVEARGQIGKGWTGWMTLGSSRLRVSKLAWIRTGAWVR